MAMPSSSQNNASRQPRAVAASNADAGGFMDEDAINAAAIAAALDEDEGFALAEKL